MALERNYTLPESKRNVHWKKPSMKDQMMIEGVYNKPSNQHQLNLAVLHAHIVDVDGQKMGFGDFLDNLSQFDIQSLADEIQQAEAVYRAGLRKEVGVAEQDIIQALEASINEALTAYNGFLVHCRDIVDAAKALQAKQTSPLDK